MSVRDATEADREWIQATLVDRWGSTTIVSRGLRHAAHLLPALVAHLDAERRGLATYAIEDGQIELVTLDALDEGRNIGTVLLEAVAERGRSAGSSHLRLVTTNDNLRAILFYQRRGLRIVAVRRGAVDEARRSKPQIPVVGDFGIEVHDEIELSLDLQSAVGR